VQLAAAFLPTQLAEWHVNTLDNWIFTFKHAKKILLNKLYSLIYHFVYPKKIG